MPDREYRIRIDIALPPQAANYAGQIRDALTPFLQYGVVINEGTPTAERGFIDIERCGHSLGLPCEEVARWEVGRGKVYPEE